MKLHPYLIFNGQAQKALDFYSTALGLEQSEVNTYENSPVPHSTALDHASLNKLESDRKINLTFI